MSSAPPVAVPAVMRSFHAQLGGGIDSLALRDDPVPAPGPGEALVRVGARSLSFRELMILRGRYPLPVRPDVVPVSDGAGEVVAVGPDVTRVAVGDRVMAAIFPRWIAGPFAFEHADQLGGSLDGMLREYAVLPAEALVAVPDALSDEQAACLPCAAVTAWNAVTGGRGVRPGETVLVLGSGGVSLFALQFARAAGARVIATTSSEARRERLRGLGADCTIDRSRTPAWGARVRELTAGRGADLVIDVAGLGAESVSAVALGGEIAFVGTLSDGAAAAEAVDARALFASGATVRTLAVGSRVQFEQMVRAIEAHAIVPEIDRVFAFEDAVLAYRHYATQQPLGKVVIAG